MLLWSGVRGLMFSEFVAGLWSMPASLISAPGWSAYRAAFDPSNAGVVVGDLYGSKRPVYSVFDPNRERSVVEVTHARLSRRQVLARDRGPIVTVTTTADTGVEIEIEKILEDRYEEWLAVTTYRRVREGSTSFRLRTHYDSLDGDWDPGGAWLPPGRYRVRIQPSGPGVVKGRVVLRIRIAPEHSRTR